MALSSIEAFNILFVAPTPNVGQWFYLEEFIRDLLYRGHSVTSIASFGARSKHEKLTEVMVKAFDVHKLCKNLRFEDSNFTDFLPDPSKNVYGGMYAIETQNIWMNWKIGLLNTEHVLSSPGVQTLIKDTTQKFDLVVSDQFHQEALYLFAHKFNCSLVTICKFCQLEILNIK